MQEQAKVEFEGPSGGRLDLVDIFEVKEYEKNPKKHDLEMIRRSIEEFGFTSPLIVNSENSVLLAGHGRLAVLQQMFKERTAPPKNIELTNGKWYVPVFFVSVPVEMHSQYVVMDNRVVERGGWNKELLGEILNDAARASRIEFTGFKESDVTKLLAQPKHIERAWENTDLDELVKEFEVENESVYQVGRHWVQCADSRINDVEINEPVVFCTDPPYCSGHLHGYRGASGHSTIKNDELSPDEYRKLIMGSMHNNAVVAYVFCHWDMWSPTRSVMEELGFETKTMAVWDKKSPTLGPTNWRNQHELIYVGYRGKPKLISSPYGNVLQFATEPHKLHPTAKPVALIKKLISTDVAARPVFDPFLGSGTTLLAAEELGRVCHGFEIDPRFLAGALHRFKSEGLEIKKVS